MKKHLLLIAPLLLTIVFATAQSSSRIAIAYHVDATYGLTASPITDVTATVKWKAVDGAKSYNLQYKEVLATAWTIVNVPSSTFILTELNPLTRYEYRVQVVTVFGTSNYSTTEMFNTTESLVCPSTFGLTAYPVTDVSATLKWKAITDAVSYNVQYREYNAASWTSMNTASASQEIAGLKSLTRYEFRIQVVASYGSSIFSEVSTFTTLASAVTYKTTNATNTTFTTSVYPNPAVNNTTVSYNSNEENNIRIKLIDITGKTIISTEYATVEGMNNYSLDLSSVTKGLYIVELTSGSNVIVKKLLVDK
jgi:hypothetical protein